MRNWIYSLVFLLLPMGALADSMNKSGDFWGGWQFGNVALYWSNFPETTDSFSMNVRADNQKKWEALESIPMHNTLSPLRPYLHTPKSIKYGVHYELSALDASGNVLKKYDELYIAPCDENNEDCEKEAN